MAADHPSRRARRAGLAIIIIAAVVLAGAGPASTATTDPDPSQREIDHAQLSRQAATEGMVLLENDGALPILTSGNVALFGPGAYDTAKGGTGSGDVSNRYTVSVRQGVEDAGYTVTTSPGYWDVMVAAYQAAGRGNYAAGEVALTPETAAPTAATSVAVYVLSRNAGEGADRSAAPGDYYLTNVERANLALLGSTYGNVIVALNVGGIVDTSFFRAINGMATKGKAHRDKAHHDKAHQDKKQQRRGQPLDAMLLMSQPGQEAGHALVDVLNGTVSPSGRTADTWASRYDYYPAAATFADADGDSVREVYDEGIYVGYRYFDSFYKSLDRSNPAGVVNYPFGYGLSYADFSVTTRTVSANPSVVSVRATVTNRGRADGKDVVGLYFSAPQTGLDKPYQELAAYAKTDTLEPGESQTLRLTFPTLELASYSQRKAAYVLEHGSYLIRVGESSRSTSVEGVVEIPRSVVMERLSNEMTDQTPDHERTSDPKNFYRYPRERSEIRHAPRVRVNFRGFDAPDNASPLDQDVNVAASSDYFPIDGSKIRSVTAYLDENQSDWLGTGAPYQPKEGETTQTVDVTAGATLYDVAKGSVSMEDFVAGLSPTVLQDIVEGGTGGVTPTTAAATGGAGATTARHEDLGIPSVSLVDGPAGVRITQQFTSGGTRYYQYATAWPIGTMLAQTWNTELIKAVGVAVGVELSEFGATWWLAPGMNIHRDPLNGRNFEYYSEDPLLSGRSGSAAARGVQSTPGVGVTIKHFVANNQETQRMTTNSVVSERTLREIYLKGFQIAVEEAQPMAIMTSYNRVQGTYTAGSYDLLNDLARGEWGYRGVVMTDWSGVRAGVIDGMYSGNELFMPGPGFLGGYEGEIVDSLLGRVSPASIQTTIDVAGLPKFIRASNPSTAGPVYNWVLGEWRLNAGGQVFAQTTVDSSIVGVQPQSGNGLLSIASPVLTRDPGFTSVQQAYDYVQDVTTRPNAYTLNDRAAAGIDLHITDGTPDAVNKFTVTLRGNRTKLRLGDLQRSSARILGTLIHTHQFAELAAAQGVGGIAVGPYEDEFHNLAHYVTVTRGPVQPG